jgi:ABC transport system ATP-binding/permease protein
VLKLIIVDDEGRRTVVPFIRQEITIGRQEGNTIRLTERNVSRHHARLLRQNGAILVEDLGSYNGVRVNGERIEGVVPLRGGDRVQIGDYQLAIDDDAVQTQDRTPTRELERPPLAVLVAAARTTTAPRVAAETTLEADRRPTEAVQPPVLVPMPTPAAAVQPKAYPDRPPPAPATDSATPSAELGATTLATLAVLNTELAGREFACARTDLKIGRSRENDIVLDHSSLSGTHARLLRDASGEWQIVDLESSNGMFVNGEAFGKARLRNGDLLELGEVKLRFITPDGGEETSDSLEMVGTRSARRGWLMAVLLLVLAGTAGAAYWLLGTSGPSLVAENPTVAAKEEPVAAAPPPQPTQQADVNAAKGPAAPLPPVHNEPTTLPTVPSPPHQLDAKLRSANSAMARKDFQRAVDILEPLKNSDGSRPGEVDEPLRRANTELAAKKKLAQAQKSLSAGKVDETLRLLEESKGTVAFAKEHDQLKARAEAARRAPARKKDKGEVKLAQASKPANLDAAEVRPPPADEDAQKLYDQGTSLYRKGQFADAASTLNQCLRIDPSFAKCHMVLGSTYAKLREPELGAQHYRRFVQLAPNDPDAAKVKLLLDQYESAKLSPGK